MQRFRDLGIRKGTYPQKKFDELIAGNWGQKFSKLFARDNERATAVFRAAHERFLNDTPKENPIEGLPPKHVKVHIELTLRSFGFGFTQNIAEIVEEEYAHLADPLRNPSPPCPNLDARMLYSAELVLSFLGTENCICHAGSRVSEEVKFQFFEFLINNGLLRDPLFLAYMLIKYGSNVQSGNDLIGFSQLLFDRYNATADKSNWVPELPTCDSHNPMREKKLATEFLGSERPFDLGSRFVVYVVDGQVGPRMRMQPEEATAATARTLASIAIYGVVPGGIVGGNINYHLIHSSVDRADIDLLSVYPNFQAVVMVPIQTGILDSGFPHTARRNAKVWYNNDIGHAPELMVEPQVVTPELSWLPRIEPSKLVIVLPRGLDALFKKAVANLAGKLGIKNMSLINVVSYDPDYWGNVHNFVEFLQISAEGQSRLQFSLGERMPIPLSSKLL